MVLNFGSSGHIVATLNVSWVLIHTQPCASLRLNNLTITAFLCLCEYWHASSWVCQSIWPLGTAILIHSLYLSPTHAQAQTHTHTDRYTKNTVPMCSHTVGDSVECFHGSIDSFEQVFGFVSGCFNSALQRGHVISILCSHTHTHTHTMIIMMLWFEVKLLKRNREACCLSLTALKCFKIKQKL